ncbi:hypothetical protein [Schleiferilactobacillus harbinensis]|uniref:WxL domain-containing protein n=1 Tax=Schleiferilactobacillus harbinensis TaxID=304207 RepID=A0A5P8M3G5_9LACO|nr:hypothetical protein [Schleiferilactobacillus harbinensis]QFR22824.1 hypothetical protein D1010_04855 [Schleiferilactobacillus harbinensis]
MRIIKRHRTKQGLVGLLLAALVGGALIAGSGPQAKAATIGDVLDNSTLSTKTNSSGIPQVVTPTGNPWSMYQIPGLGREREPSEGSFVKWGYNGWSGASAGMPLSPDISNAGTNAVSNISSAWNGKTTASPVAISFKNTGTNHGSPYFSLNYVNKDSLVDFGSNTTAGMDPLTISRAWAGQNLTAAQQKAIFSQGTGTDSTLAKSKMVLSSNGKYVLDTANNESFDGGYMQATGNVPIQAAVAGSKSTVDATMAGDWAVMVRVQVAQGIDTKAFASSIAWDKSYYYLTVDSVSLMGQSVSINFPMQFDHHVYLDPAHPQTFYLKVKGIPFWMNQKATVDGHFEGILHWVPTVYGYNQLQLQDGNADYVDYLHNRQISPTSAQTLDNLGADGTATDNRQYNYGTPGTSLDDSSLNMIKKTGDDIQPLFPKTNAPAASVASLWSIYDLIPGSILVGGYKSPVTETGQTGRMISMINAITGNETSFRSTGGNIISDLLNGISAYFGKSTFKGTAHINFSFDMSKYTAGTSKDQQALTAGRFFAAPNADGTFNMGDGTSSTSAIRITMYDSSQLVDPYNTTSGLDRQSDDAASPLRKALHIVQADQTGQSGQSGMTPADYAVINKDDITDSANPDKGGTVYPTYTNFTSWTGAIVPYDREHWSDDDSTESTSFTDTMHSQGKFGSDLRYRTASPDPANDGVLVNDGSAFKIDKPADFKTNYIDQYTPIFDKTNTAKLTTAGVVKPQRYANVYSLYNYVNGVGTLPSNNEPVPVYTSTGTGGNNLSVTAGQEVATKPAVATNVAKGATSVTSSLDKGRWRYTGTMDSGGGALALADATISLSQPLKPQLTLNGQSPYIVSDAQLNAGGGVTKQLGTWRDPLGLVVQTAQSDNLRGTVSASNTQKQNTNWDSIQNMDTKVHGMSFNAASANVLPDPTQPSTKAGGITHDDQSDPQAVTFNYKLPWNQTDTSRVYYGQVDLTRAAAVPLRNSYTLNLGAADNTATANYLIIRNSETPSTNTYQIKKYFNATGNPTTHLLTTADNGQKIPVKADATVSTAGKNTSQTLSIWVPKVAGTTIDDLPVVTSADGSTATVTNTTSQQSTQIQAQYYVYSAQFSKVPANFSYTYAYHVGTSGVTATAYNQQLVDLVMSSSQLLGQTNAIDFKISQGVNLLHAPNFDFGKNTTPTTAANYKLTDAGRADAYFEAQENDGLPYTNTYTWMLSATMNPFKRSMTDTGYNNFNVILGNPYLDAAGTQIDSVAEHQPDANGLMSDGYSTSQLFYVDPMKEPDTQSYDVNSIKRYYPNANLTVPPQIITPGKYTSTVTYTISDNGSI